MSVDLWPLVDAERRDLADLLDSLTPEQWEHHTLCAGWRVKEVVAHLNWVARVNLWSFIPKLLAAGANMDRAIDRIARDGARMSTDDLRASFRALVGDRHLPPRTLPSGVLADTIVHHQDIRRPLQLARDVPRDRIAMALAAYGPQAGVRIRGLRLKAIDVDWTYGTGPTVTGTGEQLLMCMTGRMEVVAELGGPGKAAFAGRT